MLKTRGTPQNTPGSACDLIARCCDSSLKSATPVALLGGEHFRRQSLKGKSLMFHIHKDGIAIVDFAT